jgi:hypothetical protein
MKILGFTVACLLISLSASAQWVMIWNDEFDNSTLDNTKWTNDVGGNGWGNNEAQYYTAGNSNLTLANGQATFTAKDEQFGTNEYTSAYYHLVFVSLFLISQQLQLQPLLN